MVSPAQVRSVNSKGNGLMILTFCLTTRNWDGLTLGLGPKQEVCCIAHLHLGLEGSPRLLAIAQGFLLQYITRVSL